MKTLTTLDVETEIERLSAQLEDATTEFANISDEAAEAELNYKLARAKHYLTADGPNQTHRDAAALLRSEDEYRRHQIAEGRLRAQSELLRTLRARLDALRTLAANVRSQT